MDVELAPLGMYTDLVSAPFPVPTPVRHPQLVLERIGWPAGVIGRAVLQFSPDGVEWPYEAHTDLIGGDHIMKNGQVSLETTVGLRFRTAEPGRMVRARVLFVHPTLTRIVLRV